MSYFARQMDPEDQITQCQVTIYNEIKKDKKMPLICFYEDLDQEKILDHVVDYLNRKKPKWEEEKEKYSIEVIPCYDPE